MEANDYDPHKDTKKQNAVYYLAVSEAICNRGSRRGIGGVKRYASICTGSVRRAASCC